MERPGHPGAGRGRGGAGRGALPGSGDGGCPLRPHRTTPSRWAPPPGETGRPGRRARLLRGLRRPGPGALRSLPRRRRPLLVHRRRRPGRGHGGPVRRPGDRGLLRHRERRRGPDRPAPQPVGSPHPLRQRPGRRGAAHPGRLHRRDPPPRPGRCGLPGSSRRPGASPGGGRAPRRSAGRSPGPAPGTGRGGAPGDPATAALLAVAEEAFRPDLFLARGDGLGSGGVPLLEERLLVGGRPAAYLCRGFACEAPATDPEGLRGSAGGRHVRDGWPAGGRKVAP